MFVLHLTGQPENELTCSKFSQIAKRIPRRNSLNSNTKTIYFFSTRQIFIQGERLDGNGRGLGLVMGRTSETQAIFFNHKSLFLTLSIEARLPTFTVSTTTGF